MRCVAIVSLLCLCAVAQSADDQIQTEFQSMMDLAAPPKQGEKLDEDQSRARAESFVKARDEFLARWEPRAGELSRGHYWLGRAQAMAGKSELAIKALRAFAAAAPKDPDIEEALLLLGSSYLDVRDYASAAEVLSAFLAERPASDRIASAHLYLGVARWLQGNFDEALKHMKIVIDAGGDSAIVADAQLQTVRILADASRVDEARRMIDELLAKNPEAKALLSLKEELSWLGEMAPELVNIDSWLLGESTTLAALRGRVVVLTFFADRSEQCRVELKALGTLAPKFSAEAVAFLGITRYHRPLDRMPREREREVIAGVLAEDGVTFRVAIATDVQNLHNYKIRGIPFTVVVGKDGRIVHTKSGASTNDKKGLDDLAKAIDRTMKG